MYRLIPGEIFFTNLEIDVFRLEGEGILNSNNIRKEASPDWYESQQRLLIQKAWFSLFARQPFPVHTVELMVPYLLEPPSNIRDKFRRPYFSRSFVVQNDDLCII